MNTYKETQNELRSYSEQFKKENSRALAVCFKTYGCQQNVADSERMAGMFADCGFNIAETPEESDVIVFNTCAVREHAEEKVFGHIGALKKLKESRPSLVIAVGGCMVQQQHVADKIRKSYPFVDILFNSNSLQNLPAMVSKHLQFGKNMYDISSDYSIEEGIPVRRDGQFRAFLPIMYGCNNFCTYCIVPYVRGRERSRTPQAIEEEFRNAVAAGYKDIMVLGQNVNSYGNKCDFGESFPDLLRRLNDVEGDFKIRFMTSHPKDASEDLFKAMRDCDKIANVIHLPVQCGSNDILQKMNRRYTREKYMDLVAMAKEYVPGLYLTSDIIVGFPGETARDFDDTVDLIEKVRFYSLFTFIYSKRVGTPAAELPDAVTHKEKVARLTRLTEIQDAISEELDSAFVGTTQKCLICGKNGENTWEARLDNNAVVTVTGENVTENVYADVAVTGLERRRLFGTIL